MFSRPPVGLLLLFWSVKLVSCSLACSPHTGAQPGHTEKVVRRLCVPIPRDRFNKKVVACGYIVEQNKRKSTDKMVRCPRADH